jgi:hypothetical protein
MIKKDWGEFFGYIIEKGKKKGVKRARKREL